MTFGHSTVPFFAVVPTMQTINIILNEAQSMQPLLKAGNCLGGERSERQEKHILPLTQVTPPMGRFSSSCMQLDTSSVPLTVVCKTKDVLGKILKLSILFPLPAF